MNTKRYIFLSILYMLIETSTCHSQNSIARIWNETQLNAIRLDAARPPVQARNLFHVSLAMYDAWAAYDSLAIPYLLGNTLNSVYYEFNGVPLPANLQSARNMAISYAAYRVLRNRYSFSPNWAITSLKLDSVMNSLGYATSYTSSNYASGNPADLGNYIAEQIISMGISDGSNQSSNYPGTGYSPANIPLFFTNPGNPTMTNVARWQPLTFVTCLDQNGIPCGSSTPSFICPHWGKVLPFSMPKITANNYVRSGTIYPVYFDPGTPPILSLTNANDSMSNYQKWGHSMVSIWSSHLDPNDSTMWDISPNGKGNIVNYPQNLSEMMSFYNMFEGGEVGPGHPINPATGLPYTPQWVKRGDYTRYISQYWADGPSSETPPGHWFKVLNEAINNHPSFVNQMAGTGPVLDQLEWDVKAYFTLGSAMHDAAIACWGVKGWYDSPRPISMIRKMAALGQSSNMLLPNYHPGGLQLIPGYIEQVTLNDTALLGPGNIHLNKIKLKAWKGFSAITYNNGTPLNAAGVGWILAENWMPYQRETFVTPPFAGYTSGHSTYSRAGATVLKNITGSSYFPGGLYEFVLPANTNFLQFEPGAPYEVRLQWATYYDASDEASLSRIWGSIHPPLDDMPGRRMGERIGHEAYNKALSYFNNQVMTVNVSTNLENPVCIGNWLTFYAAVSNNDSVTQYDWYRNGALIHTSSIGQFSTQNYADNDQFTCVVTSKGHRVAGNTLYISTQFCSNLAMNLRFFMQGYYLGAATMENVLAEQGIGNSITMCDTVLVELHQSFYPYEMIASQKVITRVNGITNCTFNCPADSYYVAIKHRNTIETWSSVPIMLGNATLYDFSVNANAAYGANQKSMGSGVYALYSGELNADENIDLLDIGYIENAVNAFSFGYQATDINGDGNVDLLDLPVAEENILNFIYAIKP